ncbi:capsule biosynthesis GfcC D2 domain-containing protein [Pseudidiomarina aestuarii]|uniref:capsule biosynthesis GfcC D2 domain-containing protein n=1 Tax=Pseudidiomarina aestuarii TaxID=624146 RepID=UPI003A9710F4
MRIIVMLAVLFTSSISASSLAQGSAIQVTVNDQVIGFEQRIRLGQFYQALEFPSGLYWPATRLVSAQKQEEIDKQQLQLVDDLIAMSSYYRDFGEFEVAEAIRQLAGQVRDWPLVGAEFIGVTRISERGDVQTGQSFERPSFYSSAADTTRGIKHNPLLPAGSYEWLMPPSSDYQVPWRMVGVTITGRAELLPYTANKTVRELLQQQGVFSQSPRLAAVEVISLSGQHQTVPVAYYNRSDRAAVYGAVIVIPIPDEWLIDRFVDMNKRLVELAQYWNPVS